MKSFHRAFLLLGAEGHFCIPNPTPILLPVQASPVCFSYKIMTTKPSPTGFSFDTAQLQWREGQKLFPPFTDEKTASKG